MTRKPVDPLSDANRTLAIALAVLVLLVVALVAVANRDDGKTSASVGRLEVVPQPTVAVPLGNDSPKPVAEKAENAPTSTAVRSAAVRKACLVVFRAKKGPGKDGETPVTFPPITLPTIPPRGTTTTTAPTTTEPTTTEPTRTPPVVSPPSTTRRPATGPNTTKPSAPEPSPRQRAAGAPDPTAVSPSIAAAASPSRGTHPAAYAPRVCKS